MNINNLKINGISNPVGFLLEQISLSYQVSDTPSKVQKNVRVEVTSDEAMHELIYTLEGEDLDSTNTVLDLTLKPRTTYYYKVYVTGDEGDQGISEVCSFETGKMQEEWNGEWITTEKEDHFHPVFLKTFSLSKKVARARYYGTGVGLFEVYINGKKAGNEYLMPYMTNYETCIQAITLPLEPLLEVENKVEVFLGKGWYMSTFGLELTKDNYGSKMAMIGEIVIEYTDGSVETILTDDSWQYKASTIEDSGIYDGEINHLLLWENKQNPWKKAVVVQQDKQSKETNNVNKENIFDRLSLPIVEKETIEVKEVIHTPAGELVLDLGQNFAGFVEIKAKLFKGCTVKLEFGEILQEGNFYHKNYRDAKSEYVIVSDGTMQVYRPKFTFFGFRYVKVTGWPNDLTLESARKSMKGVVLYSDLDRTGYLTTGNEKINRLYENTIWGLKSNFLDLPTDCPQRSERLGWTGDAQVFAPTASYHMDTRAFFHKFIKDLRAEQVLLEGGVPNYLPNIGHKKDVGSVWGDIATLLPETLYRYYGNLFEVKYSYDLMKDWVDYIHREDKKRGERTYLFDFGFTFGDWLALDGPTPNSFKGSTDDAYISTVYYYRSTQIVAEMAQLLGLEEAKEYRDRQDKIKAAIFHEFFTPSNRLAIDTQAAYVIALKFGLYQNKEQLILQFKKRLEMDCNQIKCGFVGAPLLCSVLAECELYELAYDFLLKEGFPSWLYSVNLGATTIWERWNSVGEDGLISDTGMNSLNHYAYGSVMEFMYGYVAGIRPLSFGFKQATISPVLDIRLKEVNCTYHSVAGTYVCQWKIKKEGKICIHVEVPFGATAILTLPSSKKESIKISAGSYDYEYMPETDYTKPYNRHTFLSRIGEDERAMGILFSLVPAIGGMIASKDPEMGARTLDKVSHMGFLPFDPDKLEAAINEISQLQVEYK